MKLSQVSTSWKLEGCHERTFPNTNVVPFLFNDSLPWMHLSCSKHFWFLKKIWLTRTQSGVALPVLTDRPNTRAASMDGRGIVAGSVTWLGATIAWLAAVNPFIPITEATVHYHVNNKNMFIFVFVSDRMTTLRWSWKDKELRVRHYKRWTNRQADQQTSKQNTQPNQQTSRHTIQDIYRKDRQTYTENRA